MNRCLGYALLAGLLASCGGEDKPASAARASTVAGPQITSSAAFSVREGQADVGAIIVQDATGVSFQLAGGADSAWFTLSSAGQLAFVQPPDYEYPADRDQDQRYEVQVRASRNGGSTTQAITVTVTDQVEEPVFPYQPLEAPVASAQVNHIIQVGQSLAIGARGVPLLHGQSFDTNFITFAGGPKALPVEAGGIAGDTSSFKPLLEDLASPDGFTQRGETGLWLAAHSLAGAIRQRRGSTGALGQFLFSASGAGGQGISYFLKSDDPQSWWQKNFLPTLRAAKDAANKSGRTYAVPAIMWVQGEANTGSNAYDTRLAAVFDAMSDAVFAETGQRPVFITYTTAFNSLQTAANPVTGRSIAAQVALARSRPDTFLGPAIYAFPHDPDGLHMTAAGYALMGRAFGQQLGSLIADGREPAQAIHQRSYLDGIRTRMKVRFQVQGGSLLLDERALPRATDYGFRIVDDAGTVPIDRVEAQGDVVIIWTQRDIGANARVRYARDYRPSSSPSGPTIAIGNLRLDPYLPTDKVTQGSHLWVHAFDEPIEE